MTLKALIGEREIATKEIKVFSTPYFQIRVQRHEKIIQEEINRMKTELNGNAHKVRFMITAQSKMNTQ